MSNVKSEKPRKNFSRKGISVTAFLSPSLVVLFALHVIIVGLIIEVNNVSTTLSGIMQRSAGYVTDATSLLAGSSVLSDTATNYVLRPVLPDDTPNVGPLIAYGTELQNKRRGNDVLAKFEGTDAPKEAIDMLIEAANNADYLLKSQLHALALITSVHPLPGIPQTAVIAPLLPALTEEEYSASEQTRAMRAADLLLSRTYGDAKGLVSADVNAAVGIIQSSQGQKAGDASGRLASLRAWLWGTAISIMVLLVFIFFLLYKELFLPVLHSSKLIESDDRLAEGKGFREMRLLSSSYNGLKARRDALDEALRIAAERDVLTCLANRFAFDHYLAKLSATPLDMDQSVTICIFDVNYLKETNDSMGHAAGDGLLKEAAYCLERCFKGGKCFRIGGDEFACVLLGVTEEEVHKMMDTFQTMQEEKHISVSYGYAVAPSLRGTDLEALMRVADDAMYACKDEMHRTGKYRPKM
ncbi:MAG: GGDEF domain-containing protein [Bacilli bacterium]|nr:GGDEF domain-containing protein [Bacilli bacterium]